MKILFVSNDLIAGNLAQLLKKEGHEVRLFIENKNSRSNLGNMVDQTEDWQKDLGWVGKDGLIIFDDVGYGKIQDELRKKGYAVFGGTEESDRVETDRLYGQSLFKEKGMKTVELIDFFDIDEAVNHIKSNPAAWVLKTNSHEHKFYNYIGQRSDGSDVISILKNYLLDNYIRGTKITLQKRIFGVEIGVGRYFNGNKWVGPIEFNVEHVGLFPGNIGPMTSEMGTIAWYSEDETNILYKETIQKLESYLREVSFKGDFEINCIVNEDGVFPLEATARFGTPIVHLHTELHTSPWGEFLNAIARGGEYDLKWKKGYGIVVLVAAPPFPYPNYEEKHKSCKGFEVFLDTLTTEDKTHLHFEEISIGPINEETHFISGCDGYLFYVTAVEDTIEESQKKAYEILEKVVAPKSFYRNDIGKEFASTGMQRLKEWGYF